MIRLCPLFLLACWLVQVTAAPVPLLQDTSCQTSQLPTLPRAAQASGTPLLAPVRASDARCGLLVNTAASIQSPSGEQPAATLRKDD